MNLFDQLHGTALGDALCDHIKNLQEQFCDIRNIQEGESLSTIKRMAELLDKEFVHKIKIRTPKTNEPITSQYE